MSRAFVRESDDAPQLPQLPPQVSPLPPGAKNYLTPGGVQRLQQELARLVDDRPRLLAAAAEDIDAKRELQVLDQRIRQLQQSLSTAEIVAPAEGPADVVRFGATVTVREADGSEAQYRIVGIDEIDSDRNWVSWLSPIARALMNAHPGSQVTLKTPRGEQQLEVVRIHYEP
jgi:transcription elongation factor GreB